MGGNDFDQNQPNLGKGNKEISKFFGESLSDLEFLAKRFSVQILTTENLGLYFISW